jgi:hypothetical protein
MSTGLEQKCFNRLTHLLDTSRRLAVVKTQFRPLDVLPSSGKITKLTHNVLRFFRLKFSTLLCKSSKSSKSSYTEMPALKLSNFAVM